MKTKHNKSINIDDVNEDYYNILEREYDRCNEESLFEVLKVLGLDEKNSDPTLVEAIKYFKNNDGIVKRDAPINFLTENEKQIIIKNNILRSKLYSILLSKKFSEAINNKTAFLLHSYIANPKRFY